MLTRNLLQARVALARAAYSKTDIVLLDDTLSALDAYVGQAIVKNCILSGPLAGRTRILVTHALHVLDKTDYIYVMDNGNIIEQGTYDVRRPSVSDIIIINVVLQALMRDSIVFAHLIEEYGTHESEESETSRVNRRKGTVYTGDSKKKEKEPQRALIQTEERMTGSVSWATYIKYFRFAGSVLWAPAIIALVLLTQASAGEIGVWEIRPGAPLTRVPSRE
jgi:ATP-binding cassette, subfamily C (CFTR/MRP), member 1